MISSFDLEKTKYLIIKNVDVLGELKMTTVEKRISSPTKNFIKEEELITDDLLSSCEPLFLALKVDKNEFNEYVLTAGSLDQKLIFYPTPIKVNYILLNSITINTHKKRVYRHMHEIEITEYVVNLKLELFDKDFQKSITIDINDETEDFQQLLSTYINGLNVAISKGKRIKHFNPSFVGLLATTISTSTNMTLLENLYLEYWEASSENRPGKDNIFWNCNRICALPRSPFLVYLIYMHFNLKLTNSTEELLRNPKTKPADLENLSITLESERSHAYSPAIRQQVIIRPNPVGHPLIKGIREYITKNFNSLEHRINFVFLYSRDIDIKKPLDFSSSVKLSVI
jgi:hypothetical protein